MTEVREGINSFTKELFIRCLYDPLEFLFKINIAVESAYTIPPGKMSRAVNLFAMKEYYQVYSILRCTECTSMKIEYNYCTCCTGAQVFLRNYSVYILTSIKNTREPGFKIDRIYYEDDKIDKLLDRVELSNEGVIISNELFTDPFLIYLLILTKKKYISSDKYKKVLCVLLKVMPYFWDIYKLLGDSVTVTDCDSVLKNISDPTMERVFILYIGCRKSILIPRLKRIMEEYEKNPEEFSIYEESLLVAVFGHYKKTKKSLEVMEKVVDSSVGWYNFDQFSNILYSLKDTEKLSSLVFTVFDRFGNLPIYNYVSGNLLALKSDHVGSIEEFQKILQDEFIGEFDIAYIFVAQEYFHLKDTCSAIKACNLAIKKNYNDYRVWLSMAQIYFSIEMHEYSLHFYRKCAELSPSISAVYEGLGQCFDKLGREEEAIRCYKKCADQGSVKALCLLGDLFFRQNNNQFITYYKEYLSHALVPENDPEHAPEGSVKTIERVIEVLEPSSDPSTVLEWRKSLTLLKHCLGA
ncbi:anaphase-promoting complex subunit 8 [Nematocida sp. AWRm78]|nr:anaphase-promoting complex subunit 8 [Nematocida sp. AWRm78]